MDRLTTLMERFHLRVQPSLVEAANLFVCGQTAGLPDHVLFYPRGCNTPPENVQFSAQVHWASGSNPLLAALADEVSYDLKSNADGQSLVQLMCAEAEGGRCGAQSVVNRLGDVLMVRLLRAQIEQGATEAGLLAGLADPRLSRAIVAIHDHPGRVWTNADLATEAGLSLSRFSELFSAQVGETPMGYLRRWRLILAHQDVLRGDRVDAVARRYAYNSPEGFTRAFRKAYGIAPVALRKATEAA